MSSIASSSTAFRAGLALWFLIAMAPGCVSERTFVRPADGYLELTASLTRTIEREMAQKSLPALSIALVDGDRIVWADGFGMRDPRRSQPATADTVYRVGSVSKLFTDIAVMQLVEEGGVDLDAPVRLYLPDFRPRNPFENEITLRQLMSHRSGLVREPPVGHYFDDTEPSLAATVASLVDTELVYAPESRTKYSNAGIAVVGHVVESLRGEPFAESLRSTVLEPMGLRRSAFRPSPAIRERLARASMWSYDGRVFDAPTFELGMAPAGSMYSTVLDLGRFLECLFAEGRGPRGDVVLRPETLREMMTPQYDGAGSTRGYGLGFSIRDLDGHRRLGHGGAIYGFATSLAFLPDEKLGVVVISSMDIVNSVTERIANHALRLMLARRADEALPTAVETEPIDPQLAKRLDGEYLGPDGPLELVERDGRLFAYLGRGYVEVRARGGRPFVDDRLAFGPWIEVGDDSLRIGDQPYRRVERALPSRAPARWRGLIGEYGWDHNVLFIFERKGKLHALIEWAEIATLDEIRGDLFAFPTQGGLYHGEQLIFRRDERGRATEVVAAGIVFPRRTLQGETASTFKIDPIRPVEELRTKALAATPPAETGDFLESDLVDVATLDPTLHFDIRYATTNNFMGAQFYREPRAFLQRPAAEALVRVHERVKKRGYGLLIHDAYRPWFVTKMFYDATPSSQKIFVADPSQGSRHNRGCAVDLTLCDPETGEPVSMTGLYDEFTERSFADYQGGTSRQRWHRELLRDAMEAEAFTVYEYEWWHFDYEGWQRYPIANDVFEDLAAAAPPRDI